MYPQLTSELAAQRRQAFQASADRRRRFGRRARAGADLGGLAAVDTTPLAHLVHLPAPSPAQTVARVA